jgi:glutathione peroxidase
MSEPVYEIPVTRIDGSQSTLADYKGSVALIVNVASACGLTPQYAGLESVYEKYRSKGLVVLGFPCNDFAGQEPGTHAEIQQFCETKFNVQFPLFAKVTVKSEGRHPLYKELIKEQPRAQFKPGSDFRAKLESYGKRQENESDVLWNFEKFLVSRDGKVIGRFAPDMTPDDPILVGAIEKALQ